MHEVGCPGNRLARAHHSPRMMQRSTPVKLSHSAIDRGERRQDFAAVLFAGLVLMLAIFMTLRRAWSTRPAHGFRTDRAAAVQPVIAATPLAMRWIPAGQFVMGTD